VSTVRIENPEINLVVPPTTWDGAPKTGKPRMRHLSGDCQHFKWPGGIVGNPRPATDEELRTLKACSDCVARNDAGRGSRMSSGAADRPLGRMCPTCYTELPVTGGCYHCE
jgi:hypothetical protein